MAANHEWQKTIHTLNQPPDRNHRRNTGNYVYIYTFLATYGRVVCKIHNVYIIRGRRKRAAQITVINTSECLL